MKWTVLELGCRPLHRMWMDINLCSRRSCYAAEPLHCIGSKIMSGRAVGRNNDDDMLHNPHSLVSVPLPTAQKPIRKHQHRQLTLTDIVRHDRNQRIVRAQQAWTCQQPPHVAYAAEETIVRLLLISPRTNPLCC
jgi:hypothetical protein